MAQSVWLRSPESGGILKRDYFDGITRQCEDTLLAECLYFDTADMELFKNETALMLCAAENGIRQVVLFGRPDEGMAEEYTADADSKNIDITLFPGQASEKLLTMIGKKPLQISFASVFELKTRVVETEAARRYILTEVQARFGTEDEKREITALEVKSADGNAPALHDYVQQLIGEAGLAVGASPWFEAAHIKESGLKPALSIKKIWKFNPSPILRALAGGLLEFEKAYLGLDACDFEKQGIYKLRVEARKLLVRLILFQDAFDADTLQRHIMFLEKLIADTDELRQSTLLAGELDCIGAAYEAFDIIKVQKKLASAVARLKKQLKTAQRRADYSTGLTALWASVQQLKADGIEREDALIASALEKVKTWICELNRFKKAYIDQPDAVHDYRSVARNVRYALESMEDVLPRRVMKVSAGLRKIQDEFGMLGDVNAHVHKLHTMALDGPDAEIAYACGVCGGIMLILQENACKKAAAAWKDYKDDFITLEGLL